MTSWRLDPTQTGLLVIDVQEKLLPAIHQSERLLARVRAAVQVARLMGIPIVVTEQVPQKLGPTVPALREALGEFQPLVKNAFSSSGALPGDVRKNLIVAGIETHVCVRQTVYDLRARGFEICLLGDCCSSRSPLNHELALAELRQDKVLISSLEAVTFEMLGSAENELFRGALAILK